MHLALATQLMELCAGGELRLNFHRGQARAWRSEARIVAVVAGAQGGKTSFGPLWLQREMQLRGPGDYLVVTPTFPLLEKNALPAFRFLFETLLRLGEYKSQTRTFILSEYGSKKLFGIAHDPLVTTRVIFGYAENPDSLESMTVKAVWCDEAGQKAFKLGSWEAIQRRVAIHQGRILLTTTPYFSYGWLKDEIVDAANAGSPDVHLIRFDSTENPAFSKEEYRRIEGLMPKWKFDLFYRGILGRPIGMIYDCFDPHIHKVPAFDIPANWPRFIGMDFGTTNTAAVLLAQDPTSNHLYVYRDYHAGGKTPKEHLRSILGNGTIATAVGGAPSEDEWRDSYKAAGLPIRKPEFSEVEAGIDRVYGAIKESSLYVFDSCEDLLGELLSYARKLDASGQPTEEIDNKSKYHRLDALRYIVGYVRRPITTRPFKPASQQVRPPSINKYVPR